MTHVPKRRPHLAKCQAGEHCQAGAHQTVPLLEVLCSPGTPTPITLASITHTRTQSTSSDGWRHNPYDFVTNSVLNTSLSSNDVREDVIIVESKALRRHEVVSVAATRDVAVGGHVIVESERGFDLVRVVSRAMQEPAAAPLPFAVRPATQNEVQLWLGAMQKWEDNALSEAAGVFAQHNFPATVTCVELQFDRRKVTVHYTADAPLSSAFLVPAFYKLFHTRVKLNYVGPHRGQLPPMPRPADMRARPRHTSSGPHV